MLRTQPLPERNLIFMNRPSPPLALFLGYRNHLPSSLILSKEDPALFKQLPQSSASIPRRIIMSSQVFDGGTLAILGGEVSAREDVGGGEGGGCFDAVQEEDFVLGGD